MPGIEETAAANWFVCLNSEKSVSKVFSLWSNPNKEPKLGRSCREELGTVYEMRYLTRVLNLELSTREVDSVLRLNIESIPVSGLGLSMLETKPDDTEELCC
ncbi:hypothetical protein Tco_1188286 [Tanacetum coccineum]